MKNLLLTTAFTVLLTQADLTEICGEKESWVIAQGKSHVRFYEKDGFLYFFRHVGFHEMTEGMKRLPENLRLVKIPVPYSE